MQMREGPSQEMTASCAAGEKERRSTMEFRKMRRWKQQITEEECKEVLQAEKRGVLATAGGEGYPYALPINFYFDEESGRIYFHCAKAGHKIDALARENRVSFCVFEKEGYVKEGDWSYNVRSVIAFGRISIMTPSARRDTMLLHLAERFYPDAASAQAELEKDGARCHVLEMVVDHMTGKLVNES